ncbi:metallopeptidase TldD-related protein [Alphaproteobacteria bacterium]|jgi:PmbA protein|nr:metallopeptidase TldD-related protein [Alphaproteobacteria bacterium]HCL49252.1 modulator protein [Rhodobiaceae bacterium]MDA8624543.1 metallopeptidase TldD-related protein [Alphaproteobacteria bacterium]MDA8643024.1 metallopeptidase TldD-related protein [Alphaproteobacteria bacterium]MDA8666309.1 metallopeptidase TldD-related protein [Alphaproteobacteria bacterium]
MSPSSQLADNEAANIALAQKLIDLTRAAGADAVDVLVSDSASLSVSCRMGVLEDTERAESRDIGLRAMIGQKQAFVSGSAIDDTALQQLAQRAVDMAQATPEDRYCGFAPEDRLTDHIPALDIADAYEPDADKLLAMAVACEEAARGVTGITNSEGAGTGWGRATTALVTSHGFEGAYTSTSFSASCAVIGGEGDAMERDYASHSARHLEDLDAPEDIGLRAGERTIERLNPRKIESTKTNVVYAPRVSASLLGHLSGAISGSAIARGTSFLRDQMGQQIMSASITIEDDPLRPRGLRSAGFDGEGVATEKLTPIDKGVLQNWWLDSASARQLELETNGRAARGIGGPPGPSATNLYMLAGDDSVDTMLKNIGTGLYVTELIGMGVNGVTGDYSRGASGFWIENGELAYPVSEVTIASNLKEMFLNMTPADDLVFRRGVNAPTILVEGMALAGL